ncbi:MAG TPA: hypothetical protein VK756_11085 [Solirubrobacteraceae bacterium]|jgi:hypothetical protein|nr:hypothetical protein [Solirubrobacteraceae bacterium]
MHVRLGLGVVLGWSLYAACTAGATPAALAQWSAPRLLAGCARASSQAAPLVVFPSSQPQVRSGPGALVWSGPGGCGGGAAVASGAEAGAGGAETTQTYGARLGSDGLPGRGRALLGAGEHPVEVAAVAGTALGQVIALGDGVLAEGNSPGAFAAPLALDGPAAPVTVASGYLGDTAVVSTIQVQKARSPVLDDASAPPRHTSRGGWDLAVRVQRHYSSTPGPARLLAAGASKPSGLAVAMDYRGDVLVMWTTAAGAIDARELDAAGAFGPLERVGVGVGVSEPRVLISDDGRAIAVWRERAPASARGGGPAVTRIKASISGPGMSFTRAALVERFTDLPGLEPPPGALRLTRLSSEAVMMAWTGMRAGRYVVRASPVSLRRGVWAPVTISPRGRQALLADLVAGPRAEVLALWTTAPRLGDGSLDPRRVAIFAAWGHYGGHGEARFAAPEALAAPGPNGLPAAAFDPQSDAALAAWTAGLRAPRIVYAQRAAGPPPPPLALVAEIPLLCDYASIESSAMRIGTPLAACWK